MNLFGVLELSGSAMGAERLRAEVVASNMANVETTHTAEGGPYTRKLVLFRAARMQRFPMMLAANDTSSTRGVHIERLVSDRRAPIQRYQPGHPDANAAGYVAYPAIDPVEEMTDLLGAVRAYQLNAAAVQSAKSMIQQSLEILS